MSEGKVIILEPEIAVALITMFGSAAGTFAGIMVNSKLTHYRLEQLEKKVDKHNSAIERTMVLEEQMKVANHRISDLEEKER